MKKIFENWYRNFLKRGFTLVELIGVVIILGLLSLLTFFTILKVLRDTDIKLSENSKTLLFSSVDSYIQENLNSFPKIEENIYCLTLSELKENDNLISDIYDVNGNKVELNNYIKITLEDSKYQYELVSDCDEHIAEEPNNLVVSFVTSDNCSSSNNKYNLLGAVYKLCYDKNCSSYVDYKDENGNIISGGTEIRSTNNNANTIYGLGVGTYYLYQFTAPEGYNLLAEPIKIEYNGTPIELCISVDKAVILPDTGSYENILISTLFLLFILLGFYLVWKTRKN